MKPVSIILTINITLFLAIGLFFFFVLNRPELIPLFTGFVTLFNILGVGGFYIDKKKDIMWAFVIGTALCAVVTTIAFLIMLEYQDTIGVEEMYTS